MAKERNVNYRAIHTKNSWRKASHETLANAFGKSRGAKALFDGKAAIDYEKHGKPLYVIIWENGAQHGYIVKPQPSNSNLLLQAKIPIQTILQYESLSNASKRELEAFVYQDKN